MENKLLPDERRAQEYRLTERLSRLTEQHFLYLPTLAATINVSAEDVMGKEFLSTWNNLAVDAYLQGRTQRQRRICKFQINQQGKWHELQDCHYFQSTRVNGLLGGIERVYPRCEHAFIHSDILQKLLAHHYALLTECVGIRHLHIADLHGTRHQHLPLGEGNLPLSDVLNRFAVAGYRGVAVVEAFIPQYTTAYLAKAREYQQRLEAMRRVPA